ncbi:MAG: hypothetical protein A3C43_00790 [Candidatus Schekmanbacteria bacterium RIFCSPHIGHO2_02_FULL_38_11]|uniref:Glycosyltransferase family 9 protein n=1 Tax=Candidatus Schekmanbacteria bacterium RIFCSPLOWO2_12_FULL_38_15 TaxID=1817883 RepID=A0A1F7SPL0_9BACT|nr:MAG: hypothetical protein A2043_07835 [Candidatus Schekmanbacteria bacterium GWA2_38_9]OGL50010.1 MAG: hypothetical protein A3C43_00790 [Candidatus Schekmanbacteria bacterium RIFCSPHIGHO2_02_FULL_38_11]OGL51124.1 MAG: hypothetical protein A3H37_08865 [Candidatus Schekmanbacteria bacterium RIFCSPLOWO2_02_FULL_38_14]OGL55124.1 MAG: hypothetical protein A3G31_02690 [Candidatus Schekmanbacteria bacterium RIFCSPLOWO2_12_FULL_38_15]
MKIKILKLIDIFIGKFLCLFLGYIDYLFNLTSKHITTPQPHKILFIRPGGMGDFLYLFPALSLVKKHFPKAAIHVLAEKRNQGVKNLTKSIDRIICYDKNPFETIVTLWRENYDVVIDTEQFHNFSGVFAYLTRAKVRIGFKTNPFRNHLYTNLINYSLNGQEASEFLHLLEPIEIKNEKILFEEYISLEKIKSTPLPKDFSQLKKRYGSIVIISPRGQARYRYWSPEKYGELIQHLIKNPEQAVILIGGNLEKNIASEIMQSIANPNHQLLSLVGNTSLLELCHMILESNLFMGCDSGVAILSVLLGIKSVILFGSADENKWGIKKENFRVVRKNLPCSPCQMLGNHKFCKSIDCMEKISAQDVIKTIDNFN